MGSQDIDFDELDKAVNSLMGGIKDKENLHSNKPLDITTTLGPDEDPAYKNLDKTADGIGSEAIDRHEQTVSIDEDTDQTDSKTESESTKTLPVENETPAAAPVAAAVQKRGGRFMDVVHPSSDMKTASKSDKPEVRHKGVTIAAPSESEMAISHTKNDNLPSSVDPVEALVNNEEPEDLVGEEKTGPEPLSSPFLADAKVEKRPLGGETKPDVHEKPEESNEPEESAESIESKLKAIEAVDLPVQNEEIPVDSVDNKDSKDSEIESMNEPAQSLTEVTEHVPDEYNDELLAVEKNADDPIPEDESSDSNKKSPEDNSKDDLKKDLVDEKSSDDHHKVISIPKQYLEKPSSGDNASGSIFDTKHYHKPVAHPAEQKSGWLWVIVIIVLIVVGALLGAAAYFFGLI